MDPYPTILLVDDSENDLLLARAAFKAAGFKCLLQEAHNGEEAIAYLKGADHDSDRSRFPLPALMLLDLNMPRKNGFDVLKWLRTQPQFQRMPVIVLSASTRTEDIDQAFELGANSYLVKPGAMDDFIAMVRCLRDWFRYNQFTALTPR